jgi:segregation and condensation protein A
LVLNCRKSEFMAEEEKIVQMIIEKENWEEIIYYIINIENLDPWNVDLVKLSEKFLKFLQSVEEINFKIPAKIVFVAAILLRMKAEYLSIFEEEESEVEELLKEQKPFAELGIDPNLVQLGYPMRRIPKRQVTLEELITALKKALAVKERREVRARIWRERLAANVEIVEEDIEVRIQKILKDIDDLLEKSKREYVAFSELVKDWKKDKVIEKFVPLLHLEQDEKISTEQEDFFKEIYISKKIKQS